jgi:hypothetical protein
MARVELAHEADWKRRAAWCDGGYYRLDTADVPAGVEVRLFVTEKLFTEASRPLLTWGRRRFGVTRWTCSAARP